MPSVSIHVIRSAVMALFFMIAAPAFAQAPMSFDTEPLIVRTASGKTLNFTVEIADTNEKRQRGLMYRKQMADDAGMIFDFGVSRRVQMWMENTVLPLDMLFVDSTSTITSINANAVPYSEDIIDSTTPVKYVVELNAGAAAKLGIKPGDKLMSATTTRKN